ncbi:MAG: hypothetical protein WC332_01575 [Clostridia bacterium]
MTQNERVCELLIMKGKWTKAQCHLCRKIHRSKCPVLVKNQKKELTTNEKGVQ